jgi:siroheme synthase-like protein
MGYLPIFVDMRGRDCLVVGGGSFAESRVNALVDAQAVVTLIAPEVTPRLATLANGGVIHYCARDYISNDMRGRFMAWAAMADPAIARVVAGDARAMGVLINAADRPELCDFITPAVVKRGAVQVAISTGGASPALARRLRERTEAIIGPEYGTLAEILRRVRPWLRNRVENPDERARIMLAVIDSDMLDAIRRGDQGTIERLLQAHLGTSLENLGLGLEPPHDAPRVPDLSAPISRAPTLRQP